MSFRRPPLTTEDQLADLYERLRRAETALASLPARLLADSPFLPDGRSTGDLLAWDANRGEWIVVPVGTVGQHLVANPAGPGGLHWVT